LLKVKDGLYNEFIRNIKPVKKIINPIRMTSVEASGIYDDESLDFVFIDAAHDYTSVKIDIRNWLPKVRKGGVLSGHDYSWWPEVKQAVDESFSPEELIESEGCWIHNKK
jgi:predicted O-methyltransferase YrrM